MLMEKAKEVAAAQGYCGIYTQGQDNNPGACLFYLNSGFYIGGLDTNVYRHTKQEGKADILFYCENKQTEKNFEKVLTPTLRNSLEYVYREEGKANDDSK